MLKNSKKFVKSYKMEKIVQLQIVICNLPIFFHFV